MMTPEERANELGLLRESGGMLNQREVFLLEEINSLQAKLDAALSEKQQEIEAAEEAVFLYLKPLFDAPVKSHEGSCTPESGCDAGCMDVAHYSDFVSKFHGALARHDAALTERVRSATTQELRDAGWVIPAEASRMILSTAERVRKELLAPGPCGKHPKLFWRSAEEIASTMTMCTAEATHPARNILILPYCTLCAECDRATGDAELRELEVRHREAVLWAMDAPSDSVWGIERLSELRAAIAAIREKIKQEGKA